MFVSSILSKASIEHFINYTRNPTGNESETAGDPAAGYILGIYVAYDWCAFSIITIFNYKI